MSANVLTRIVNDKQQHVAACKARVPLVEMDARAKAAPAIRDFYGTLKARAARGETALITEIKKASPSAGLIRPAFDPAALARTYESAGASCLSVLTDTPYFQGRDEDFSAARMACALPVLRKDFMIDPYQISESRALGADCVLLIMACLKDALVEAMLESAAAYGMSILVEVHDEEELGRFLALKTKVPKTLLGINNRNLKTLAIDLATTERLAAQAGNAFLLVGESGIKNSADIARLKRAGVTCFLVGENLLKQDDIAAATRGLLNPA